MGDLAWFGFWIMIAISDFSSNWYRHKLNELELKYKVKKVFLKWKKLELE